MGRSDESAKAPTPRAARPAGSTEALKQLARARLGMGGTMFYAPSIPRGKLEAVREVHAAHLPEGETIVALHDTTLFGSAEDGFVITEARLCWKQILDRPRSIAWDELDPSMLHTDATGLSIAGNRVEVFDELAEPARALFVELAQRARQAERGPYRDAERGASARAPIALAPARIVALVREHLGETSDLYVDPDIPKAKQRNALDVHADHLGSSEPLIVLFDDTVFGSAREGFILTSERIAWKNISEDPKALAWAEVADAVVERNDGSVTLLGGRIDITGRRELLEPLRALLRALGDEAKRASAGDG
jgi:hypothetical protein